MTYAKIANGSVLKYPFTLSELRNEYPNVSFPRDMSDEMLAEYGVFRVAPVARPDSTLTQDPVEQTPQLINGVWTQVWAMMNVSAGEAARRQQEATDIADIEAIKADAFVQSFVAMTPAGVTNYVNNNTANVTQIRALLVKMSLMLLALARHEYR